jgi:amidase
MIVADDAFELLMGESERAALEPAVKRVSAASGSPGHAVVSREGLAKWQTTFRTLQGFEAWRAHGDWVSRHWDDLTAPVRGRFEAASKVSPGKAESAAAKREEIRAIVRSIAGDDGVIVLPTVPTIAPPMNATEQDLEAFRGQALSMLCISGLSGFPQVSLPMARVDGCPLGLSLIGPPGRDKALLRLAQAILNG